jgi:hypothetical protein
MTATCRINARGDGGNVTDPETGEVITPVGEVVYDGKCRVRPTATQSQDVETGGAELASFDYVISIPFAVVGVREGHRVTVTGSPDPALVGTVVEVRMVDRGDHITARRLSCQEVT